MKKVSNKTSKLMASLILLVLAFLSVLNVTYSYFTSTASADGDLNFSDLDAYFSYTIGSTTTQVSQTKALNLYSATGTIARNEAFQLSLTNGGTAISSLTISTTTTSCDAYIRFWVDAYLVTNGSVDTSKNYGKYFLFKSNEEVYTKTNSSAAAQGSWCYYSTYTIKGGSGLDLGNELTLTDLTGDSVPISILGEKMQITVSYEAVQKANKAYQSVFADTKGYCTDWS